MTGAPATPAPVPHPSAPGPGVPGPGARRPPTVVAAVVVVLVHAAWLSASTVVSVVGLTVYALGHPGVLSTPGVLVAVALGNVLDLVLAAGDVVLGVRAWGSARRSRLALTLCLGLAWLLGVGGLVAALVRAATPSALLVVGCLLSTAALVLLWLPSSSRWFRRPPA